MYQLDKNIRPQDDFFKYVNNHWLINNPIPNDESSWGTFYQLRRDTLIKLNQIIKDIYKTEPAELTDNLNLLKRFISSARAYSSFKQNHLESIYIEVQKIEAINNQADLAKYLGYAHKIDIKSFWSCYVDIDDKDATNQVIRLCQNGLTLPNRDYYLEDNKTNQNVLKQYRIYFEESLKSLINIRPIKWDNVIRLEKDLAKLSLPQEDLRNVDKCYNRFSLNDLNNKLPNFDWLNYFYEQGWQQPNDNIVIDQPNFVKDCLNIFQNYDLNEIKDYLIWRLIDELFNLIDADSSNLAFNFHGKAISGRTKQPPLWKRIINLISDCDLGEVLGQEFTKKYFPETAKQQVLTIVEDIRDSYHKRIDEVSWMEVSTKKIAHQKLDKIRVFIGYPDKWRQFDKLKFCDNNLIANYLSAKTFQNDYLIAKIGQKPDPNEWYMDAHAVNAYNAPNQLVICFPAGILQPPFFDQSADYATNLGGIGTVIGHELTHSFDDMGCDFDQNGNFKPWQKKEERKSFNKLAQPLVDQADHYEVLPGLTLNGKLVLGEIIADIGGLELAIESLKNKFQKNYIKEADKLFINFAICECGAERKKLIYKIAKTDEHPTSQFRVNASLMHINDFYLTYKLEPGDKLFLPKNKRIKIW